MRALASRTRAASSSSPLAAGVVAAPRSKASIAMREATSPACAPPIPSATTNTGERAKYASSFARRARPVSECEKWSVATRSIGAISPRR